MKWGTPILESALTLIDGTNLYYRRRAATQLATTHTFEQVAALFWTGDPTHDTAIFVTRPAIGNYLSLLHSLDTHQPDLPLFQKLHMALALASVDDLAAYDL